MSTRQGTVQRVLDRGKDIGSPELSARVAANESASAADALADRQWVVGQPGAPASAAAWA